MNPTVTGIPDWTQIPPLTEPLFHACSKHSMAPNFGSRSKAELRIRVLHGTIECLRNGITAMQDMYTLVPQDEETLLAACAEVGIRVVLSTALRDIGALASRHSCPTAYRPRCWPTSSEATAIRCRTWPLPRRNSPAGRICQAGSAGGSARPVRSARRTRC